MDINTYYQLRSLPLQCKIVKSIRMMEIYFRKFDGDVYIATGGLDSTIVSVLADMSIELKDIERACVASVEPPGNIKFNRDRGDTLLVSHIDKKDLITEWGYPLISKEVAMAISRYTRTKFEWVKEKRLNGYIGRNGKTVTQGMIPKRYQVFIYAPFEFTEKCCLKTKKGPMHEFEKQTGKKPITGERAEESRNRKIQYLKHGCITITDSIIKCTPLGFWTDEDKIEFIKMFNLDFSPEYGKLYKCFDGTYSFTGDKRTGCNICGFGLLKDPNRFNRLKTRRPKTYEHMMGGGHWIRKKLYRWVKFRPDSKILIWSNLYWVPNKEGYGYRFVLNYIFKTLNMNVILD